MKRSFTEGKLLEVLIAARSYVRSLGGPRAIEIERLKRLVEAVSKQKQEEQRYEALPEAAE